MIADTAAEEMIKGMIKMINNRSRGSTLRSAWSSIPSGITEVEKRAVGDSAEHAEVKTFTSSTNPWLQRSESALMLKNPWGI